MQRTRLLGLGILVLGLPAFAGPASAQVDWPEPPPNWWVDLEDGGYPSASYEVEMGMPVTLTQSIQSIEGTQITVATSMSMMGNQMPAQSQIIDATMLTPEGSIAMMQSLGGGPPDPNAPTPEEALEAMNAMVDRIEDTTCPVGDLVLDCTVYEITAEGVTSRVWHAPSIPPVFLGGIVRSEASFQGQTFTTSLSSYSGSLMD